MNEHVERILGKDEKFFDLLEASANEANLSTTRLKDFLATLQNGRTHHVAAVPRGDLSRTILAATSAHSPAVH
jgi:hypothetical protein